MKKKPFVVYFFQFYFNTIGLVFKSMAAKQLIRLFSTPRKKVLRSPEIKILNEAQKTSFKLDGYEIIVYEWGTGKRLAILFHGWESNAGSMGAFIKPLLEKDFKVVSFDAPAHGKSGGRKANLVYFKSIAKQVIAKFGVPELAIGHSLGANSILMTAYETQIAIPKVILISPLDYLMSIFEEMQDLLKVPNSLFNLFIKKFGKQAGYTLQGFYFHEYAVKSKLNNVLILHDKEDKVTSYFHAESLTSNWEAAQLISVVNSGHYRILWSEQSLNAVLNFTES